MPCITRTSAGRDCLFALGAVVLLAYTYPFKYWGLGEFAIFLIWGPIMIAGVYFVLSGVWNWNVVLAGIPYGLGVASINIGKHIDKHDDDKAKGVAHSRYAWGRHLPAASIRLHYPHLCGHLISGFCAALFHSRMLIVLFAFKHAWRAIKLLDNPRPAAPPEGYPAWPTWFSAATFFHNRQFGGLLILGLIIDAFAKGVFAWLLAYPLTQLQIFNFQPRGFGVFQNSRTRSFLRV